MSPTQIENIIKNKIEALHNYSEQHSCILATAVFVDTLNTIFPKSGIYPLTVEAIVFNQKQAKQLKSKQELTGNIRVIGHQKIEAPKNKWSGHLVAIMPNITNKTRLIDLTITQANSEQENNKTKE